MKKTIVVLSAIFLAALLTACAASGPASGTKVKCPACGADFNYVAPSELQ